MFQLTSDEYTVLKCQIGTSKQGSGGKQKLPLVFIEPGVAMLSSVLKSTKAIQVNISIVRVFIKMRQLLATEETLSDRVGKLEKGTDKLFRIVFERLDNVENNVPVMPKNRKKIGLK